jgi:hypothetical protein
MRRRTAGSSDEKQIMLDEKYYLLIFPKLFLCEHLWSFQHAGASVPSVVRRVISRELLQTFYLGENKINNI